MLPIARTLILVSVGVAVSLSAHARRKRAGTRAAMAVFPVVADAKADTSIAAALDRAIATAVAEAGLDVLMGARLAKRLKLGPRAALKRCEGDVGCIAKLGKRVRADEVLFARAVERGAGRVKVVVVAVAAARGNVARTTTLEIGSTKEVAGALAQSFADIFETSPPPGLAAAAGRSVEALDGDLNELALAPLPMLEELPVTGPVVETQSEAEEAGPSDAEEVPLDIVLPEATVAVAEPVRPVAERTPVLLYAGIGVAGLGVAALGGGTVFGVQSRQAYTRAKDKTVNQVRAKRLEQKHHDGADRANLLFVTAGALGAAGAVLIVIDRLVFDLGAQAQISVTTGGASASLTFEI